MRSLCNWICGVIHDVKCHVFVKKTCTQGGTPQYGTTLENIDLKISTIRKTCPPYIGIPGFPFSPGSLSINPLRHLIEKKHLRPKYRKTGREKRRGPTNPTRSGVNPSPTTNTIPRNFVQPWSMLRQYQSSITGRWEGVGAKCSPSHVRKGQQGNSLNNNNFKTD